MERGYILNIIILLFCIWLLLLYALYLKKSFSQLKVLIFGFTSQKKMKRDEVWL